MVSGPWMRKGKWKETTAGNVTATLFGSGRWFGVDSYSGGLVAEGSGQERGWKTCGQKRLYLTGDDGI